MIDIIRREDRKRRREKFEGIAARQLAFDSELQRDVATIVNGVRLKGDAALIDYTRRFDRVALDAADLRVDEKSLRETAASADSVVVEALREAIRNVRTF